jgi:5-hydroxyisourate hydrolase-like protein (transthyretin family)
MHPVDGGWAAERGGGRVEGVVVSMETGTPLAGVEVWLDRLPDPYPAPRRRTWTDEAGRFVFERVHPGDYRLYAQKPGYLLADYLQQTDSQSQHHLAIKDGAVIAPIQIRLEMSTAVGADEPDQVVDSKTERSVLSGMVSDAQTGAPLPGVRVSLMRESPVSFQTRTAADGRYHLEGIPAGQYTIWAQGEGVGEGYEWGLKRITVTGGLDVVSFELWPAPLIAATVEYIGSGAAPVAGDYMISVQVEGRTRGISYQGQERFEFGGLTAGAARIGVGFAALGYELAAILVGDRDVTGQAIELHPGEKLTDVRILITDHQIHSSGQ